LVEDFYRNIATPALAGPAAGQTASVRETSSAAAAIRRQIEAKFGAASSVALLTISRQAGGTDGENSGIKGFPTSTSAFRIYYSYTPALGFAGNFDQTTLKQEVYRPHNTALFYRASAKFWPPAMAQPHREGEWPEDIYLTLDNTTFALPHQQDPLFYRALFYYDEDGVTPFTSTFDTPNPQYAPYTNQKNTAILKFGSKTTWFTNDVYSPTELSVAATSAQTMDKYTDSFAMGRVNLIYAGVGMMYIEWNGTEATAYYGYLNGYSPNPVSTLRGDNPKTNWGYYAVVPYGAPAPSVEFGTTRITPGSTPLTFSAEGSSYYAYRINSNQSSADSVLMVNANYSALSKVQSFRLTFGGVSENYYCNVLFAGAITRTQADTTTWGSAASPYQVRHADQLWGYLPRVYATTADRLEEVYDDKYYVQTHSFDMTGYQYVDDPKQQPLTDDSLKATYDGGGHTISGYTLMTTVSNTNAAQVGMFGGLFARLSNGGQLINVHMTDVKTAAVTTGPHTTNASYTCVGILAGQVEGDSCVIKDCSVEGAQGSGGSATNISVTLGGATSYDACVGGLIGYMEDVNDVINCSVKNIDLTVNTGTISSPRDHISVGGLLGKAYGTVSVVGSNVSQSDVSVTTGQKTSNAANYLEVGGLIGWANSSITVDNCAVSDSDVEVAIVGSRATNQMVGGLIGNGYTTTVQSSSASRMNIAVESKHDGAAIPYLEVGGLMGRSYTTGKVSGCTASDIKLSTLTDNCAVSNQRYGGLIGNAENGIQVTDCSVSELITDVNIGTTSRNTEYLEVGGLIGRARSQIAIDGCSVSNADHTIEGASWTGTAAPGNKVWRVRCGALAGTVYYSSVKSSRVTKADIHFAAPLGRKLVGYAGLGALVGYSEASTAYTYDNNEASDVRFDLDWTDSANSPITGWGGLIGWAYSTAYSGVIQTNNSFTNVTRTVRDAQGASATEAVTDQIGRYWAP
jgi:hypothetical protein